MLAGLFSVSPAVAELPACSATRAQKFCGCDFTKLRPLQGAVGMGEVTYKASTIANDTDGEYKALKKDPIKVVVGPDGYPRPQAGGYKPPTPEVFVPAFAAWPAALRRPASPATLAQPPTLN
jgi:hypothetical protein